MVARSPMPSRIRRASARTISAKLDAARSLMPASLEIPADSRASRIAAASSDGNTPSLAPSANCASASDRASLILPSAARSLRLTTENSIILAMKMVQVTSEAKARPIMTALTSTSAAINIDHDDISCGMAAVDFGALPSDASVLAGTGAEGTTAAGACDCVRTGTCGAEGAAFCWACDSDGSDAIARAKLTTQTDRKEDIFILQPSRK